MLPFMSAAPLPKILSSTFFPEKGGCVHNSSGPVGTTSVCPRKQKVGPSFP